MKTRHSVVKFDRSLFTVTIFLVVLGLIAVADASAPQALNTFNDKYYFFKSQFIWAGIGLILMGIVSMLNYKFWEKTSVVFFFTTVAFLIIVLIPAIGIRTYGARRWLDLGFLSFQPSEMVKLSLITYFASLANNQRKIKAYLIPLAIISLLVMLQPDLGTNIIIAGIGMIQLFVSGVNIFHFLGITFMGLFAVIGLIFSSPYRKDRLLTFVDMATDPLGKGYHVRQILIALGSGGMFGLGLGASKQKFLFLPEAATDSIFAVIAEEIGFIGSFVIIILLFLYLYRGFKIAVNAPDTFSRVLATGIVSWIGIQIFVNLGSITAITPLTGVPLPFFSYGGTSLVMILVATGILLNISKYEGIKKLR